MDSYFILFLLSAIATANAASLSVDYKTGFGGRITGGSFALIKEFPYQVSLMIGGEFSCGGSIIDKNHVLTAAHCVDEMNNATVRAGSKYTYVGGSVHKVTKYQRHQKYINLFNAGIVNDIAILRVYPSFKFDKIRAPIKLHDYSEKDVSFYEGEMVTITGFGDTKFGGKNDGTLRVATVNITNREKCSDVYEMEGFVPIWEDRFCAKDMGYKKDTCTGDSGGPVVINGRQIGITSYGHECAVPGFPGVYTNVAYFARWIKKNKPR